MRRAALTSFVDGPAGWRPEGHGCGEHSDDENPECEDIGGGWRAGQLLGKAGSQGSGQGEAVARERFAKHHNA